MFAIQKSGLALFCALFVQMGIHCQSVFAEPASSNLPEKVSLANSNFTGDVDADAKSLSITGSNCIVKVSGAPTDLTVVGSNNKVNIPAGCPLINLTGSSNSLRLSKVSKITIVGSNNIVHWATSASGRSPLISNLGANNQVTKVGPQIASRPTTAPQKVKTQISHVAKVPTNGTAHRQKSSVSMKKQSLSLRSQAGSSVNSVDISPDGIKIKSAAVGN